MPATTASTATATISPLTLAIRAALTHKSAQQAEQELALIAHNHGDDQVALIIQELNPGEVAQLILEGDYTKPSMAAGVVTPDKFIEALERIGATWGEIKETDDIWSLHEQVSDFVLSVLLHVKSEDRFELVEVIRRHDLAQDVIVMICLGSKVDPEWLSQDFSMALAEKGTWQELLCHIEESHSELSAAIRRQILKVYSDLTLAQRLEMEEDPFIPRRNVATKFVRKVLNELVRTASSYVGTAAPTPAAPKGVFSI